MKNKGTERFYYENRQLQYESNWKDGKRIKELTEQQSNNRNNNIEALKTLGEALGYKVTIKK